MRLRIATATVFAALLAASPAWAADNLFGDYVYAPLVTSPAGCARLLANYDRETTQTITVTASEIKSNQEGFGPVRFGETSKGVTPFVLEYDGADGVVTMRGNAILKSSSLLVLAYEHDPADHFCRLQR